MVPDCPRCIFHAQKPKKMVVWWEPTVVEAFPGQLDSLGSKQRIAAIITEAAEKASDHVEREFRKLASMARKKGKRIS